MLNITKDNPYDTSSPGDIAQTPAWLAERAKEGNGGPIVNSALIPQDVEIPGYSKTITVSTFVDSWTDYGDYLGKVNAAQVVIEQRDRTGVKLTETCKPLSLLLKDVIKEDVWMDGLLYFRQHFVMEKAQGTWNHSQFDQGTKRLLKINQTFKPQSFPDFVDQAYLDKAGITTEWGHEPVTIKDQDGNVSTVGDPVSFNGWGSNIPAVPFEISPTESIYYLNFSIYESADFSELPI